MAPPPPPIFTKCTKWRTMHRLDEAFYVYLALNDSFCNAKTGMSRRKCNAAQSAAAVGCAPS